MRKISLVFLFIAFVTSGWAQRTVSEKGKPVRIQYADTLLVLQQGDSLVQKLIGNVALSQDSVYMTCDSAILINQQQVFAYDSVTIQQGDSVVAFSNYLEYDGSTRKAFLQQDVVLVNGKQQLFTNRLDYDLNTKVASYFSGATLVNDSTQLSSKRGYYYVEEEEAFFKDSVVVSDPQFSLRADTLKYNTALQIVYFLGPTLINTDSSKIYCESGYYDTGNGLAEFSRNAQYEKGDQRAKARRILYNDQSRVYTLAGNAWVKDSVRLAEADTIQYFENSDKSILVGNARFKDDTRNIQRASKIIYDGQADTYSAFGRPLISEPPQILEANSVNYDDLTGLGIATGSVSWQDTSANLIIYCDSANYKRETDYLKAMGGPYGRPELVSILDGDSLYMISDTLIGERQDTLLADSARQLKAFFDVRIFKSDLQAICDSMVYNTTDSLFKFYKDPVIWSDTSQFTADTILMQMANDQIDRVYLIGKAFIINQTNNLFYNQIKGKKITAYFEDNELRRIRVSGNAETIYYAKDEGGAFIGVNKTICSEMVIFFGNNEVTNINYYKEPQSEMTPMQRVNHSEMQLKNFRWRASERPDSRQDLYVQQDQLE